MLLAMVGANLLSGLSMNILMIQGDAPPSPHVLRLAGFVDITFIPILCGFKSWREDRPAD